jgi:hypothetical protein
VVNPEASPSSPREVGEAEPVLTLPPGAMRRWQDSGGPVVPTTLVQCGWWLVVRIYRELPIVGNALPIHPYDIFQCNFFKGLWKTFSYVTREPF